MIFRTVLNSFPVIRALKPFVSCSRTKSSILKISSCWGAITNAHQLIAYMVFMTNVSCNCNLRTKCLSGKRRYSIKLWKTFTDCFNCLPVAAVIDEKIFCMFVSKQFHYITWTLDTVDFLPSIILWIKFGAFHVQQMCLIQVATNRISVCLSVVKLISQPALISVVKCGFVIVFIVIICSNTFIILCLFVWS